VSKVYLDFWCLELRSLLILQSLRLTATSIFLSATRRVRDGHRLLADVIGEVPWRSSGHRCPNMHFVKAGTPENAMHHKKLWSLKVRISHDCLFSKSHPIIPAASALCLSPPSYLFPTPGPKTP
jgi:hypothetical protein